MILGSHNSWSYARPKKWWMKLLRFTAKCQDVDIRSQYEDYRVRCFDLRIREKEGRLIIAHGLIEYNITLGELQENLRYLNKKGDTCIRLILEIRRQKDLTNDQIVFFIKCCKKFERYYKNIKFWCGKVLVDYEDIFIFDYEPTCEEKYSSVCKPKLIDDLYPRYFAKQNNKKILEEGTDKDILLIDFVNIK